MCGFNIVFSKNRDLIDRMNNEISHRGIRTKTVQYFGGAVAVSHRRLPIVGLNKQWDHPYWTPTFDIGFVGEMYNARELYPELDQASDVAAFSRIIHDFPTTWYKTIDGMFALFIVEKPAQRIRIYTDFLAKKPVYYLLDDRVADRVLGVSSEIKPLLQIKIPGWDELYFSNVAKWGYCPGPRTPWKDIYMLPPGAELIVNNIGLIVSQRVYDQIHPIIHRKTLYELVREAVINRSWADVPFAYLLSGGLDSTIVYVLAPTDDAHILHYENGEEEFVKKIGVKYQKVTLHDEPHATMDDVLRVNESPVDLGSIVPQYQMSRAIAQIQPKIHVALSGDGADELFGGYRRAEQYDSQYSDTFCELPYYHLPRLDKMMAHNLIELRSPFLARKVVEKALSIPWKGNRQHKEVLKREFDGIIPDEILNRKKKPLKVNDVIERPEEYRLSLIEQFKSMEW